MIQILKLADKHVYCMLLNVVTLGAICVTMSAFLLSVLHFVSTLYAIYVYWSVSLDFMALSRKVQNHRLAHIFAFALKV